MVLIPGGYRVYRGDPITGNNGSYSGSVASKGEQMMEAFARVLIPRSTIAPNNSDKLFKCLFSGCSSCFALSQQEGHL